jgi:O-antigen/teichoic acid export membrane protein
VYSRILNPAQIGTAELITSTANLITPVMYLSVADAVIRFAMEKQRYKRSDILSVGLLTACGGFAVLWCFCPLIMRIEAIGGYWWLIYAYCFAAAVHAVFSQFVRGVGLSALFAVDGLFTTITNIAFNLVFIINLDMGITGYVLGTVLSDALSAVILFFLLKLWKYIKIRGIDKTTAERMFIYCLPMLPTAIFWWITNLSDRYFVNYFCGADINGLYAMAYKIPTMITLVSAIFTRAWEISAFTEYNTPSGAKFFSNVFNTYRAFVFLSASALILLIKPITYVLMGPAFHASWEYAPLLILATSFSCLVTFLGAIYNAVKKNAMVPVTTFIGASVNLALNWLLIPIYGAQGASFATCASFAAVFAIRAIDSRRHVRIRIRWGKVIVTAGLLAAQIYFALQSDYTSQYVIFGAMILLNLPIVLTGAKKMIGAKSK